MSDPIELAAIERGAGPTVALVHGGVFHANAWAKQISPLAEAGFRAIAVDRRGHGRSQPGDADFIPVHLHADDLRLTLELRETQGVHLVGVSYGAMVCLEFALSWPKRVMSMTLIEPPLFTWLKDDPDFADWYKRFEEIASTRAGRALQDWLPEWMNLIDARMASEINPHSPAWPIIERQAPLIFKEEAGWQWEADRERLGSLEVPTLVISGDQSEPAMQEIAGLLSTLLPMGTHTWIDGAGHDPHARHADIFNDLLLDFLTKQQGLRNGHV